MDNPSLTKKPKIETLDGVFLDISAPTVNYELLTEITDSVHFVQSGEEMRIDKIANRYYGDCSKMDAIMWANNIYNPFAVDVSDYICIPKVGDESVTYAKTPQKPKNPDRPQATTSEKITSAAEKLNGSTASALKEREEKRGRVKRPTNMLGANEKSKHVEGGSIVLGN